jgi:regulator of replication initiation timing
MKEQKPNTVKEEEKPEGYDHYKLTVDLMQEKKALLEENAALRLENEKLKASLNEMIEYSEKSQYEKDREHYSIIETKRRNAKSLLQSPVPPEEKPIPEDYYIKGESQTL